MRGRRTIGALMCAATLASGCIPDSARPETLVMDVLMLLVGAHRPGGLAIAPQAAGHKLTSQLNVDATVTIGGLSGTYDVVLGSYGQFTGTAQIIGQKGAKLTDDGSPALLAAVHGILVDALAADVTVTEAKAKINGKQTTGGVHKRYKGKIKFKGTLASGADAGTSVKGKISTAGDLTD
jgi:hypothetical protein